MIVEGLRMQQVSTGYQGSCLCNISWIHPEWANTN